MTKDSSNWRDYFKLLRYVLPYKKLAILQFLLMILATLVGLLKPWPFAILIDNVAQQEPLQIGEWLVVERTGIIIAIACFGALLLHIAESLIGLGSTTVSTLSCSRMIRDLRYDVLRQLNRLSLRFHDKHRVGDLVHRVCFNTPSVETAFQGGLMGGVKSLLMLTGMFVVMLHMNALLTLIAIGVAPFLVVSIRWYAKRIYRYSRKHQDQEGTVSSTAEEILSSVRLIRAFGREKDEQDRFGGVCEGSIQTRLQSTIVQKLFGIVTALILVVGTILFYWIGIRQVLLENLTIGEFTVFNAYLAMLYSPLSVLSSTASSLQVAFGAGSRVMEILESNVEIEEKANAVSLDTVAHGIEFKRVSFAYEPNQFVLQDLNFQIDAGEIVGIVGQTGAGKSTLLNLLLRFYDPDGGRICIDGHDIRDVSFASLHENIGFVPQECSVLSGTIRENIAYARPEASDNEVIEAADRAEAHEFIAGFENGYETVVGERGVRLSVGQRQRVAMARAFLKDAPILLLDEPTSALDAETETRVMDRLEKNHSGRTLIIVAHRLSTIRRADRILVISKGHIVESGSHPELMDAGGAYARMWKAQMEGHQVLVPGRHS